MNPSQADGCAQTVPTLDGQRPRSVMIVDDYQDAATTLATLLRLRGIQALVARSGTDALALARRYRPDAILMELRLADMSGWELARELRQQSCPARLIALTTIATAGDASRCAAVGIDHVLVKTVSFDELMATLDDPSLPPVQCGIAKLKAPLADAGLAQMANTAHQRGHGTINKLLLVRKINQSRKDAF